MTRTAFALLLSVAPFTTVWGQVGARKAGHAVGQFGAGVGEAVGEGISRGMEPLHPQWITIGPRSKEACFAESDGVVNPMFMRCRNGWQEQVRYDKSGNKIVLRERPIPIKQGASRRLCDRSAIGYTHHLPGLVLHHQQQSFA